MTAAFKQTTTSTRKTKTKIKTQTEELDQENNTDTTRFLPVLEITVGLNTWLVQSGARSSSKQTLYMNLKAPQVASLGVCGDYGCVGRYRLPCHVSAATWKRFHGSRSDLKARQVWFIHSGAAPLRLCPLKNLGCPILCATGIRLPLR